MPISAGKTTAHHQQALPLKREKGPEKLRDSAESCPRTASRFKCLPGGADPHHVVKSVLVAISLIAAVGLPGCAVEDHPAGAHLGARSHRIASPNPDPRQVAHAFATFYATIAANEDHPATKAQVAALARQLAPSCSPAIDGQYPCVVHLPGRVPPVQHCVAVVESSGHVTGRCSAGATPAPVVTTGYVDCASVGRVVSITDVSDDEARVEPLARPRLVSASDPQADLVQVRVAATATRFCADFRTLAPIGLGSVLTLYVNREGAPTLSFAPTINYRGSRTPQLQSPIDTPAPGRVGTSGDWTSLVVSAGDPGAPLPRQPFRFRAYADHETSGAGPVRLVTDSAPDTPRYASYP
jgi:hypothetical protein